MSEDWFSRLTGFKEDSYTSTRARLEVSGTTLRSKVNGRGYNIGHFKMARLAELRSKLAHTPGPEEPSRVSIVSGDVRAMHLQPEYADAVFQVASQFNALEMVGPSVSPEDGVTRYQHDRTQGPACAIAAGAATIYRNYFVPVGEQIGQTATHQLNGLEEVGVALSQALDCPLADLWVMRNGYALPSLRALDLIAAHLDAVGETGRQELMGLLRVGVHQDVEVTDGDTLPGQRVTQVFCSALPVAYGSAPQMHWGSFAQMVLDAAYEATMLVGALNSRCGGSNIVLLTQLGGGAFGNATEWIHKAIERALIKSQGLGLDVRLVSYGPPSASLRALIKRAQVGHDRRQSGV